MSSPVFELSIMQLCFVFLGIAHVMSAVTTIYLHRCRSHKSISMHPVLEHFCRFCVWLTSSMVVKEWVGVHRKHHAKCETSEDPHSPMIYGIGYILFMGAVAYHKVANNKEDMEHYCTDATNDWLEKYVYSYQTTPQPYYGGKNILGLYLCFAILVKLFGIMPASIMWLLIILHNPWWSAGVVNGLCHYFGYRNFATNDTSTNITFPFLSVVLAGEQFHNNHHAFPRSPKLSYRIWEIDVSWIYIKFFSFFGLMNILVQPPTYQERLAYSNTVNANDILSIKMVNIDKYDNMVMSKALVNFKSIAKSKISSYKRDFATWWLYDSSMLTPEARLAVDNFLKQNTTIKNLYDLRSKLVMAWQGAGISSIDRARNLLLWCDEAETLSIPYLSNFVQYLRSIVSRA